MISWGPAPADIPALYCVTSPVVVTRAISFKVSAIHSAPSGPVTMPTSALPSPVPVGKTVTLPCMVMRSTWLFAVVAHKAPSGPTVIRPPPSPGVGKVVTTPAGVTASDASVTAVPDVSVRAGDDAERAGR